MLQIRFSDLKVQELIALCCVSGLTLNLVLGTGIGLRDSVAQAQPATILTQNSDAIEYYQRGVALYQSGDMAGAEAAFRKAIELNPNLAEAHANLGSIWANQNKLTEAISQFQTAIRLKPNLAVLHYQLGVAYYLQNQLEPAIVSLTKARDLFTEQGKLEEANMINQALQKMLNR